MLIAILGALLAGALTTLAPCALSLLPVVVGGSFQGAGGDKQAVRRALVITASLGASVVIFTLLLKATTALIGVSPAVWRLLSGGLLIILGLVALFPQWWDKFSVASGFAGRSATGLSDAAAQSGTWGAVLTGAALGPVFTSCSPLFGYVIVTVLPAEPKRGLVLLAAYVVGMCSVLLAVALIGQRLVRRLRWASDPHSPWRRMLGALFIVIGLLIATGAMQVVEAYILEHSPVAPWEIGSNVGQVNQ